MNLSNLSSNWKQLQAKLDEKKKLGQQERTSSLVKRKRTIGEDTRIAKRHKPVTPAKTKSRNKTGRGMTKETVTSSLVSEETELDVTSGEKQILGDVESEARVNEGLSPTAEIGKYISMDCEMVGVGPQSNERSALARVSIVNFNGDQVYDSYVKVKETVTDWRTHVSGILPKHMAIARPLEQVQKEVSEILEGNILVGHAIRHDLEALFLSHPRRDIRDTSLHLPYRKLVGGHAPSLKVLASRLLGIEIQTGQHSSVVDARVTMLLYRNQRDLFERDHAKRYRIQGKTQKKGKQKKKKK